ncbi:MAG: hypothetical protein PHN31_01965 [Candidatus Gracilibacteria bacterium]|nr:hypothetical protein [Candidatus Gracilibacteria bacterium]
MEFEEIDYRSSKLLQQKGSELGDGITPDNIFAEYYEPDETDGIEGIWLQKLRVGEDLRKNGYGEQILNILCDRYSKVSGQIKAIEDIPINELKIFYRKIGCIIKGNKFYYEKAD